MKYNVVRILFENSNRIYFFSNNNLPLTVSDFVVVESEKGNQFGKVISEIFEIDESKLVKPLKNVIRIANNADIETNEKNKKDAVNALKKARDMVQSLNLNMNILSANFTLDRNQLAFNFIADDRVDFRELAKRLAGIYKTRIELRQIGVRDKAKEIGGLGPCGRFLCCNLFLNDFETVSINMAKNQYISLKPDKINGVCGRLLCCLNYEDDQYTELKREFPSIGTIVKHKNVSGKVISHNLFKRTFDIESVDKTIVTIDLDEYEGSKWFIRL